MRTSVDIPDDLFRQAKARAAMEGRSLRELIEESLRTRLAAHDHDDRRRLKFPLIRSSRRKKLTFQSVKKILETESVDEDVRNTHPR